MTTPFDLDTYIDALPSYRLMEPRRVVPRHYHDSHWPLLKSYNGFTGEERRRGGQLIGWLQAAGYLPRPSRCQLCGGRERVGFHSESYYHVLRPAMLCNTCHMLTHRRHFAWDAWRRLVDACTVTGREWWALAPRYGHDLATHLRASDGWAAADIERSLPDAIATILPKNLTAHPIMETRLS